MGAVGFAATKQEERRWQTIAAILKQQRITRDMQSDNPNSAI
jgi:hypothetical protein